MENRVRGELFGFSGSICVGGMTCRGHASVRRAGAASVELRISAPHCRVMEGQHPPVVVVNPLASGLADPARRDRVVEAVVRAVEVRTGRTPVVADASPEAARELLAGAAGAPLVVAIGGDGTIRESAAALAGSGIPMAIVPAGTGNVFAAALGIPRRTADAVRLIGDGRPGSVDLGAASWGSVVDGLETTPEGTMPFAVACGIGFDARVMSTATTELKRRLGFFAYVVATLREAARLRAVSFRIDADGEVHEVHGLVVIIANCGQLIPGLIGPRQPLDPTDGLLDVIVVTARGIPGGLVGAAESLLAGNASHRQPRSMRFRAARVRVAAEPREPVQIDGDAHEADWLEGVAVPGALLVVRP
jgi:diacylglycerol kinase (ATP)